jgi:uroporphyrinogen decarboxylase
MIPRELYRTTGFTVACSTISRIKGPTATHLASSPSLGITEELAATGTLAVGVGSEDDLARVKAACAGKLAVFGNLNGVAMRGWTPEEAARQVRAALAQAAPGGGFILSDSHGEIPFPVSHEVLAAVSDAVHTWGTYPLRPHDFHDR